MDESKYNKEERADGTIVFTPIEKKKTPRMGEVWTTSYGSIWLVCGKGMDAALTCNDCIDDIGDIDEDGHDFAGECLGKFDEVFIRKSEILDIIRDVSHSYRTKCVLIACECGG